MPFLILTVGLPKSGKTTWARNQGYPMVSPDAIRAALHGRNNLPVSEEMVWTLARYMVLALFGAGHERVILDTTNITVHRRDVWRDPRWELRYRLFTAPASICIQRALECGRPELVPIIETMAERAVYPTVKRGTKYAIG